MSGTVHGDDYGISLRIFIGVSQMGGSGVCSGQTWST